MKPKLLIFDFDGTLADTGLTMEDSMSYTLQQLKIKHKPAEMEKYAGMSLDESFEGLMPKHKIKQAIRIFLKHYEETYKNKVSLFPKTIETLDFFSKEGKQMAIFSSKKTLLLLQMLKHLGLKKYFSLFVGGGQVKRKPNPEGIFKVIDFFGANKEDIVMIGDSRFDILAGKRAGIKTVSIGNLSLNADISIGKIEELRNVI